jgi:ribonuclease-3
LDGKRKEDMERFILRHNLNRLGELDLELVDKAFHHPSYIAERGDAVTDSYQRLEFLGDAVLGMLVARYLYRRFPDLLEGDMTRMRSVVVCEAALVKAARKLNLGAVIQLGKGERLTGGAVRPSILADCMEALLGALFLSGCDLDRLTQFMVEILHDSIKAAERGGDIRDYKSRLQELVQKNGAKRLTYFIVSESGPDHNKVFCAGVAVNDEEIARAQGRTKQDAEQKAAKIALAELQPDPQPDSQRGQDPPESLNVPQDPLDPLGFFNIPRDPPGFLKNPQYPWRR